MSNSKITRLDDGKPAVTIIKKSDFTGELNIPTREKSRSMKKKPELWVFEFIDDEGGTNHYVYTQMSPSEKATIFGSMFSEVSSIDEDEAKAEFVESLTSMSQEEAKLRAEDIIEKTNKTVLDHLYLPDDHTIEDIEEMDTSLRDDLFEAMMGGVPESGDSVDTFPEVDEDEE